MNKIMETLFEIEDKATNIIDHVSEEKKKMDRQLDIDMEELKKKVNKDTEDKINDMKDQLEKEIGPEKLKLYGDASSYLENIEIHFTENREKIAEKVFLNIIGK